MMNHIIKLFMIAVAMVTAIPSFAVSDQEMELARTIAAKHYLRYANNGSDYLDKLNPSTMGELQKSLKSKEIENIKSFNAVAVPKDYASWDKAKLVQYWSNTFFKSAGLKEDGKKCLGILSKNLSKIEVKATQQPMAKPEQEPKEQPSADPNASDPIATNPQTATDNPSISDDSATTDPVLATPEPEELEVEEERPQRSSGTIWYVVILIVLIGVVVWLVMYAQKSMKETGAVVADRKNSEMEVREAKRSAKEEVNKMRDQYASSISTKNEEIKQLRAKCEALEAQLEELRIESARKSKEAQKAIDNARLSTGNFRAYDTEKEVQKNPPQSQPARRNSLPPVVYLGMVNQRGLFVKASRSLNAEYSVYRMDIPDGVHGTFRVANEPTILDRLLEDPSKWLTEGCDIENPGDADIATEIVTLVPGQAIFSDNTCRVVRKARIKFI